MQDTKRVRLELCRWGKAVPQELKALVEECWSSDAEKRPHFIEISARLETVLSQLPADFTRLRKGAKCPVQ